MEGKIFRDDLLFDALNPHFGQGDNGRYYLEFQRLNNLAKRIEDANIDPAVQALLEEITQRQCKILCKFSIN